jgi:hypothetical protein
VESALRGSVECAHRHPLMALLSGGGGVGADGAAGACEYPAPAALHGTAPTTLAATSTRHSP